MTLGSDTSDTSCACRGLLAGNKLLFECALVLGH